MSVAKVTAPAGSVKTGPLLVVEDLRIERLRTQRRETVVSSMSLSLDIGETIGIVGESGSGKSMTARAITGLLPPTLLARGQVTYDGRDLLALKEKQWRDIRGREIGLVLQDPFTMLSPVMRCGRAIGESLLDVDSRERGAEVSRRLTEVGISDPTVAERYPFELSGGMRQRVGIAAALARNPRVLIADEPSTALDVTTQAEILGLIKSIQASRGMSLILITHDLRVAFEICNRVYVLYAGSLVEVSPASDLEQEPLHPYTQGLLLSEPPTDHRIRELVAIPGAVPAADDVANCCSFAPRCRWAQDVCREEAPPLAGVGSQRLSACVRLGEIRGEMAALRVRAGSEPLAHDAERPVPVIVTVVNAFKTFHSGARTVKALTDVSIEIGENESVALVGESGSGKTTLARALVGLERLDDGEITISGISAIDWSRLSTRDRKRLRSTVQIVFQDPNSSLNPMRTIGWTLAEALTTHGRGGSHLTTRVGELLDSVGLPPAYAQRKPVALSGGERQRVAIARALAAEPRLIICDEVVSALDVSVQAQILNVFKGLQRERGLGYLFITHDLAVARQMTDYVYVMYRGRIVESGNTDGVLANPTDAYTQTLLASVPGWSVSDERKQRMNIEL